jgi:hypothetical protein
MMTISRLTAVTLLKEKGNPSKRHFTILPNGHEITHKKKHQMAQMDTWQLPISIEKSKWLLVTNKQNDPIDAKFELARVSLPKISEVGDLRINFNSKMNFTDHVSSVIAKAKQP